MSYLFLASEAGSFVVIILCFYISFGKLVAW